MLAKWKPFAKSDLIPLSWADRNLGEFSFVTACPIAVHQCVPFLSDDTVPS